MMKMRNTRLNLALLLVAFGASVLIRTGDAAGSAQQRLEKFVTNS